MEERGMNERIRKLRKLSLETPAHIDMERAKSMTDTYEKYEGALSIPELRAQVLKDYFSTKTLYIGEGELVVGENGRLSASIPDVSGIMLPYHGRYACNERPGTYQF